MHAPVFEPQEATTWHQNTPAEPDSSTQTMSRIRIANPQLGTAKYTTASRAERYVRRKEALIIDGELHFLSPTEQRRPRTFNQTIQSERRASDVYVDQRADEKGAIWWNGSDTRKTAMHKPGENVQFASPYVAAMKTGC